ncbi:tetratricopeptide repeat protein [Sulfurovum sp. NBC37-1]|uniref:tetratricopeptide repeat protein n=1 Tax=Sulfurovum sp. (strain NBC37-1) TaxID=387093 RepID=UPI0001587659|nr:SEL1-like repeat protein [Sulfurovum sp. NBC37-1]BAF72206.1 hypothetical protein SUN_1252 [Sulfurovum sp. NBC37-1]
MKILILLAIVNALLFGSVTDEAYKEYKKGHYKKAFSLYSKGYMQGNVKAAYNLATFYEKGIGIQKNPQKAYFYYNFVHAGIELRLSDPAICTDKMLPYYYKTIKKMAEYNGKSYYNEQYETLKQTCSKTHVDPFIKKCPSANIIARPDRYCLDCFDCILYKKYPKRMRKILHLHTRYRAIEHQACRTYLSEALEKKEKAISKEIYKLSKPILRYYLKQEENCVKTAKTKGDLLGCSLGYCQDIGTLIPYQNMECGGIDLPDELRRKEKIKLSRPAPPKEKHDYLEEIKKEYKNPPLNIQM